MTRRTVFLLAGSFLLVGLGIAVGRFWPREPDLACDLNRGLVAMYEFERSVRFGQNSHLIDGSPDRVQEFERDPRFASPRILREIWSRLYGLRASNCASESDVIASAYLELASRLDHKREDTLDFIREIFRRPQTGCLLYSTADHLVAKEGQSAIGDRVRAIESNPERWFYSGSRLRAACIKFKDDSCLTRLRDVLLDLARVTKDPQRALQVKGSLEYTRAVLESMQ
jgi:hypothetical protein